MQIGQICYLAINHARGAGIDFKNYISNKENGFDIIILMRCAAFIFLRKNGKV